MIRSIHIEIFVTQNKKKKSPNAKTIWEFEATEIH